MCKILYGNLDTSECEKCNATMCPQKQTKTSYSYSNSSTITPCTQNCDTCPTVNCPVKRCKPQIPDFGLDCIKEQNQWDAFSIFKSSSLL